MLLEVFFRILRFPPLLRNQHFQIPTRPGVVNEEPLCGCAVTKSKSLFRETISFKLQIKKVKETPFVEKNLCSSFVHIRAIYTRKNKTRLKYRLQNSPYFCVFTCARAVKQKVSNKAENRERDWGKTLKILSPHKPYGRVRLARASRA